FSSRRRHTRSKRDWSSDVCSSDLVHVIIASVDRELGSRGHAGFVVPPGTKGLEQGSKVKKHGLRASHTADVHLDDCRIPGSCLRSEERRVGKGWRSGGRAREEEEK